MRPLVLEVKGLRSYVEARVIDFTGKDLAAIIGDTGAGKSSILEAICFALYGKPSWSGSDAKSLISHGVETMEVKLTFTAGGETWEVYRSTSKGGYPAARHALVSATGDKHDGKKDVDDKIRALVGLDHKAFLHCVILPQGRFQDLLQATSSERTKLLKGVFQLDALDRVREWTADTLRERQPQLATLRLQRARLRQDPAAEAEAARVALEAAQAQHQDLHAAEARHRAHAQAAAEAGARASEIDTQISKLDAEAVATTRVHVEEVRAAASRIAADQAGLAARRSALQAERAEVVEALAARTAAELDIAGLTRAGKALDSAVKLVESMERDREDVARCEAAVKAARKARDAARTKHRTAVDKREQAQRASMAAHLAATLVPGEACPVCAQTVQAGFHAPATPDQAKADKAVATAGKALEKAESALGEADGALSEASRLAGDNARKLREKVDQLPAALRAPVEASQGARATLDALAAARAQLQTLRDEVTALEARRDGLARALAELDEQAKVLDAQHTDEVRLRTRDLRNEVDGYVRAQAALAALLGRAPLQPPPRDADVEALDAVAGALATEADAILAAAASRAAEARQARSDAEARAHAILAALGCAKPEELTRRMTRLDLEIEQSRELHQAALAEVEPARALDARIATAQSYIDVLDEIRVHMADGKFLSHAVERKQQALLTVASRLLGDMTSGRFGFGEDFTVVDRRAGEARDAETLSGGETFLASLALALALVELAGRAGGRLEALFLDEGFGSLDAGTLDLAIEALIGQARQGRLVAVISHIRAVAESIDTVLYVHNTPTGSDARWLDESERNTLALDDANLLG